MLKVYAYQNCSTCRKAGAYLAKNKVAHTLLPIRETPPTTAELKQALSAVGGNIRKLFNTSGLAYKELGLKDKLPGLGDAAALKLLAGNGNLVKRPFVVGPKTVLIGFKEEEWKQALR